MPPKNTEELLSKARELLRASPVDLIKETFFSCLLVSELDQNLTIAIMNMILTDKQSASIVEKAGFLKLMAVAAPSYKVPAAGTVRALVKYCESSDTDVSGKRKRTSEDDKKERSTVSNSFKHEIPHRIVMVNRIPKKLMDVHIRRYVAACGLTNFDVRCVENKTTGNVTAYVEFLSVSDAKQWMDMRQGMVSLQNHTCSMQYMQYGVQMAFDWFCVKCGGQNFKKRFCCYRCKASRHETDEVGSGRDEICLHATKTIMLRNLDTLTTEDTVHQNLRHLHTHLMPKVSEIYISRDPLTSISRGICYLGTDSVADARALYSAFNASHPLEIDGKHVTVSFCKYHLGNRKRAYLGTASPAEAVDNLAEYSAMQHAKSADEYREYLAYYKKYYAEGASTAVCRMSEVSQMDATNAAAAVAHAAMQRVINRK